MARSLSSLFLGVLALTLVALQGALAIVDPGIYIILTEFDKYLSVGPVPLIYPPVDVPLRLLDRRFLGEAWEISSYEGGQTIRLVGNDNQRYGIVGFDDGAVFATATKKPEAWAVSPAGDGVFTIGAVNEDKLFTQYEDSIPAVVLRPADGSADQRWRLIRIDRDLHLSSAMYGKSRFNVQCNI